MRPIDADALIADIRATFEGMEGTMASSGALYAIVSLKSAPTLTLDDLRPKGRWNPLGQRTYGGGRSYTHYCSECGQHGFEDYTFCPNCGADMRGGVSYESDR